MYAKFCKKIDVVYNAILINVRCVLLTFAVQEEDRDVVMLLLNSAKRIMCAEDAPLYSFEDFLDQTDENDDIIID